MNRNINFVRDRQKKLTKSQAKDLEWRNKSLIGLGLMVGLLLISVGVRFAYGRVAVSVEDAQKRARDRIISLEETERTFVISVNKLSILTEIFEERRNKQQAIQYFTSVFGEDVLVRQIAFNGGEQLLTFRLQADDVFVLEEVFQELASDEVKSRFVGVNASDLSRRDEGKYEMTVAVTLGEAGALAPEETSQTDFDAPPPENL